MNKDDKLNYKWLWILTAVGFVFGLLIIIFSWKVLFLLAVMVIFAAIGIAIDIFLINKREKLKSGDLPPSDEED